MFASLSDFVLDAYIFVLGDGVWDYNNRYFYDSLYIVYAYIPIHIPYIHTYQPLVIVEINAGDIQSGGLVFH